MPDPTLTPLKLPRVTPLDYTPEDVIHEILADAVARGDLSEDVDTHALAIDLAQALYDEREQCARLVEATCAELEWIGSREEADRMRERAREIRRRPGGA